MCPVVCFSRVISRMGKDTGLVPYRWAQQTQEESSQSALSYFTSVPLRQE